MPNFSDIATARAEEQKLLAAESASNTAAQRLSKSVSSSEVEPNYDAEFAVLYSSTGVDIASPLAAPQWPDSAAIKAKPMLNEPLVKINPGANPAPLLQPRYHRWGDNTIEVADEGEITTTLPNFKSLYSPFTAVLAAVNDKTNVRDSGGRSGGGRSTPYKYSENASDSLLLAEALNEVHQFGKISDHRAFAVISALTRATADLPPYIGCFNGSTGQFAVGLSVDSFPTFDPKKPEPATKSL